MKKFACLLALATLCIKFLPAQVVAKTQWMTYTIGGDKYYYIKNYSFANNKMVETNKGGSATLDKMKTEVEIVAIEKTADAELVITKYDDTTFGVHYFNNITAQQATVFTNNDNTFTSIEAAKAYMPTAEETSVVFYTKAGFAIADKKKVMPEMQKKDLLAFANYFAKEANSIIAKYKEKTPATDDEKMGQSLAMTLLIGTLPSKYATEKGFHAYKSVAVIEKAMKKFKKDKDLKKILDTVKIED
jgi:hypothetical protein